MAEAAKRLSRTRKSRKHLAYRSPTIRPAQVGSRVTAEARRLVADFKKIAAGVDATGRDEHSQSIAIRNALNEAAYDWAKSIGRRSATPDDLVTIAVAYALTSSRGVAHYMAGAIAKAAGVRLGTLRGPFHVGDWSIHLPTGGRQ